MSNNMNALYNAVVVATNHHVPATIAAASGAHAAAVQAHAAAAPGAAAHGAANVAGNVAAAAGTGTTAQHSPAAPSPVEFAPENDGLAFANSPILLFALDASGQPVSDLPMRTVVPPPLDADLRTKRQPIRKKGQYIPLFRGNADDDMLSAIYAENFLPPVPLVFPDNLFAPAPAAASGQSADTGSIPIRFWAELNTERIGAIHTLDWNGDDLGLREDQPRSHAMTPDDYQNIRRFLFHRGCEDTPLLEAEANCAVNKGENLRYLLHQRRMELWKTASHREPILMGAEAVLAIEDEHRRADIRVAAEHAASAAREPFLPPPPPPPPHPPSVPSLLGLVALATVEAVAGAVISLLGKRKRRADDDEAAEPEQRPAKRARVELGRDPQPRFVHLRHKRFASPPPRPRRGVLAATNPEPLPYNGAAAYPIHTCTSDAAMQTDPVPESPAVAGPSRQPPSPTPSLADAGVAGPSQQPQMAPPSPTPSPSDATPSSPTAVRKEVRFKLHASMARPPRLDSLPPRKLLGGAKDDAADDTDAATLPPGYYSKREWATHSRANLARWARDAALSPSDPTARGVWAHPHAQYAVYRDFHAQHPRAEPAPDPEQETLPPLSPSPPPSLYAAPWLRTNAELRRVLKEAATAIDAEDKMDETP